MKRLNVFLCCIFFVMSFFIGFFIQKGMNKSESADFIHDENLMAQKIMRLFEYQNVQINDFIVVNTDGDSIMLSSLIDNQKFVIYWSKVDCAACATKEFMSFDDYFSELDKTKNIILLSKFKNTREQRLIEQITHFKTYNVIGDNFFKQLNNNELFVTYCLLDSTLTLTNYLDAKENNTNIDINKIYYIAVSKRLKNKSRVMKDNHQNKDEI